MNPKQDNHHIDKYMRSLDDQCQPAFQPHHWEQLEQTLNHHQPSQPTQGERHQDIKGNNQKPGFAKGIIITSLIAILAVSFIWFSTHSSGSPNLNSLGTFIPFIEETHVHPKNKGGKHQAPIGQSGVNLETSTKSTTREFNSILDQKGQNVATINQEDDNSTQSNNHTQEQASSALKQTSDLKGLPTPSADTLTQDLNTEDTLSPKKKKKFLFW